MFEPHSKQPSTFSPLTCSTHPGSPFSQFKLLDDANPFDLDILCDAQQVPPDLTDLVMPHDLLFGDPSWAL
jgi:hypothetical protein